MEKRIISSPENERIKLMRALFKSKKSRDELGLFAIEGVRLCEEALAAGWLPQLTIFSSELSERGRLLLKIPLAAGQQVVETSPTLLSKAAETQTPQGILMAFARREIPIHPNPDFVLVLDRLSDPGNLGTLLRGARAFGVQVVLISPECADAWSPKTLRAGMGAHFHVCIKHLTQEEIIAWCSKFKLRLLLADMHGILCWNADLKSPLAFVIGGEAEGAGKHLRAAADDTIAIPMPAGSESLNAAAAGSILLYETARQRAL